MNVTRAIYDQNPKMFFDWVQSDDFDPDIKTSENIPLWVDCLKNCHLRGMLFLLENGANIADGIEPLMRLGLTGLFLSTLMSYTNRELLRRVIISGIDLNILVPTGEQPSLQYNKDEARTQIVMIELHKPLISLIATDSDLRFKDIIELMNLCIANGANINLIDSLGNTVLFDAAVALFADEKGSFPIVEWLLLKGVDINIINHNGLDAKSYFEVFVSTVKPELISSNEYMNMCKCLNNI